ncbi:bifunctional folylpolyglutamate synthase/dihydrofolate synthase [Spirochaetia bacterium]|nr:bifunctional folylpolyglutamate synthase/dihydrofolate synthase [Spirochaetia bacterium]GHU33216.1 bifunctional folylpolyglutamate synthase/dihydrofolate synthase [Spirochaetia bacterium]
MNDISHIFEWISSFINFEKTPDRAMFRLERMRTLAALAGNPERVAPVIHVAGSKGKGSVTTMIASVLQSAGMKVARYTSPHIKDYRERISTGAGFFPEEIYDAAGRELHSCVERFLDSGAPTFFEVMTLYFFLCAREFQCDAMVVETGMGGRLDATNIVDPVLSIITLIELEHTEYLGTTLEQIAAEKAGIIKANRPVLVARQKPELAELFRHVAADQNSPFYYVPDIATVDRIHLSPAGSDFHFNYLLPAPFSPLQLHVPVPGTVQAENAASAVLGIRLIFPSIYDAAIQSGLANLKLPARFERIAENPVCIRDGAHTPESFKSCTATFTELYGTGGILLFGCAIDKDSNVMAESAAAFSHIIITVPGTFKKSDPEAVYRAFAGKNPSVELIPETESAIRTAREKSRSLNLPLLITGSFYLAAATECIFLP